MSKLGVFQSKIPVTEVTSVNELRNIEAISNEQTFLSLDNATFYRYDPSDTTSPDNGDSVIVNDTTGQRYKDVRVGKGEDVVFTSIQDGINNTKDGGYFFVYDTFTQTLIMYQRNGSNASEVINVSGGSNAVAYVNDINGLQSLVNMEDGQATQITTTGRAGLFRWDSSDLSAEVASDPQMGIYVPPTGQDGSAGAWVRDILHGRVLPAYFGADYTGQAVADDGFNACTKWAAENGYVSWVPKHHIYLLTHGNNPIHSNTHIDGDYGTIKLEAAAGVGGNNFAMFTGANETDGATYPATRVNNIRISRVILDGNKANQTNESDYHVGIRLRACDDVEYNQVILKDWSRWGIRTLGKFASVAPVDPWTPIEADDYCTNIRYKGVVCWNVGRRDTKQGAGIQSPACKGVVGRGLFFFDCVSGYFGDVYCRNVDIDGYYANSLALPTINNGEPSLENAGSSLGLSFGQSSKTISIRNASVLGFDTGLVIEASFDVSVDGVVTRGDHKHGVSLFPSSVLGADVYASDIRIRNVDSVSLDADVDVGLNIGQAAKPMRNVTISDSHFETSGTNGGVIRSVSGLKIRGTDFIGTFLGFSFVTCDDIEARDMVCRGQDALRAVGGGNARIRGGRLEPGAGGTVFGINNTSPASGPWRITGFSCPDETIISVLNGSGDGQYAVDDYSIDGRPDTHNVTLSGTTIPAGGQIEQTFAIDGAIAFWQFEPFNMTGALSPVIFHTSSISGNVTVYALNPTSSDITFSDTTLRLKVRRSENR